jgi:hypothetical protein
MLATPSSMGPLEDRRLCRRHGQLDPGALAERGTGQVLTREIFEQQMDKLVKGVFAKKRREKDEREGKIWH